MADIKQAAKWMQEGKRVKRISFPRMYPWEIDGDSNLSAIQSVMEDGYADSLLTTDDLLAEDWEIAE